jgi:flagellar biosynthesis/type III secretory pathway protein FliH
MGSTTDTSTEHRYQLCTDEFCERFPCRVYKEGQRDGYSRGWHRGHADGYAEGYREGVNNCPLSHA